MTEIEAIRYLEKVDRWQDAFEPLAQDLVELREARAAAWERATGSPTAMGSKRQVRESPAWRTFLALQDRCGRLAEMLLLTPRAAQRAGVRLHTVDDPFDWLDRDVRRAARAGRRIYGPEGPMAKLDADQRRRRPAAPRSSGGAGPSSTTFSCDIARRVCLGRLEDNRWPPSQRCPSPTPHAGIGVCRSYGAGPVTLHE